MKIKNRSFRWIVSYFINCLRYFGPIYMFHEIYYKFFTYVLENLFYERCHKDALRCLKRYMFRKKMSDYSAYFKPIKNLEPCVWTCWLQGYDNAPAIVKACINSIYKCGGGHAVIVITEENMSDYICMPDFILDKYKRGLISNAHFSDLLRTLLLFNYGGVWVDATVLLTKEIPQIILDSDFFVFRTDSNSISPCSNWFITARKGSPLLKRVFEVLAEYWKYNKYPIDYYIYHICVRLVITYDEDAKQIWKNMFPKNNADLFFLHEKLFDNMDVRMKDYLWDLSFAHKLTYKAYIFGGDSILDRKDTFYQYIISENLNDTVY